MRTSAKKLFRRGMVAASAGLALLLFPTGAAAAHPAAGDTQLTVTAADTAQGSANPACDWHCWY